MSQGKFFRIVKSPVRKIKQFYFFIRRYKDMKRLDGMLPKDICIFSSNCWGGHIYQDRNIPYNSPTAGLFFFAEDYVDLLEHFREYIKRNLVFIPINESRYEVAKRKFPTRPHWYPIAVLDGTLIEIHFLHYHTEQEAKEKWRKRLDRMNFEKLLIIGMEQNLPNAEIKKRFIKLPFQHKMYFCVKNDVQDKCMIHMREFTNKEECPNPYIYAHKYYKYMVEFLLKYPYTK